MRSRYYTLCFASGIVWAWIAYVLGSDAMDRLIWGGIVVSPLIGLMAGALYRPAYRWRFAARWAMSLFTLYVSAALFGLACGVYDAARGLPGDVQRSTGEVVLQSVGGTLWGVTFTGYVILLWPLAHLNHWWVGRRAGCSGEATRSAEPGDRC